MNNLINQLLREARQRKQQENRSVICKPKVAYKCWQKGDKNRMLKIVWNGKKMWVCGECFQFIKDKELKELEVSKLQLQQGLLWEQGARSIDVKSYLDKWIKQTKDNL